MPQQLLPFAELGQQLLFCFFAQLRHFGEGWVAADAVNSPKEFMVCKQLIGKAVDPRQLVDPETDLKSLLA